MVVKNEFCKPFLGSRIPTWGWACFPFSPFWPGWALVGITVFGFYWGTPTRVRCRSDQFYIRWNTKSFSDDFPFTTSGIARRPFGPCGPFAWRVNKKTVSILPELLLHYWFDLVNFIILKINYVMFNRSVGFYLNWRILPFSSNYVDFILNKVIKNKFLLLRRFCEIIFTENKVFILNINTVEPPLVSFLGDKKSCDYLGMCDCLGTFVLGTFVYWNSHIFLRPKRVWLLGYEWKFGVWLLGGSTVFILESKIRDLTNFRKENIMKKKNRKNLWIQKLKIIINCDKVAQVSGKYHDSYIFS